MLRTAKLDIMVPRPYRGLHEGDHTLSSDTYDFAPVRAIAEQFRPYPRPWWIAGGWAVDLRVGHVTRHHDDLDVLILHRDLPTFREALGQLSAVVHEPASGKTWPWREDESIVPGRHALLIQANFAGIEKAHVLLAASDGEQWVNHRGGGRNRMPLKSVGLVRDGLPYLIPRLTLQFKWATLRPQDDADFHSLLPFLDESDRALLAAGIRSLKPDHPWLPYLGLAKSS